MEFRVLGRVAHRRSPTDPWREPRGVLRSRLLATLVTRLGDPVPHDDLVEALWGGTPDDRAAAKLHLQVHRLRQELGDGGVVVATEYGYRLDVPADRVDAVRFERAARQALALTDTDPERPARARAALDEWADTFAGVAYEGIDLPLCTDEAERLALLRLDLAEAYLSAEVARGRHLDVVHDLQRLATEHPLRESLQALVMDALHQGGRQAEALAVYRATRSLLVTELGLEPSARLRTVHEAILTGTPTAAAPRVPAQLPPAVGLEGRAADLAAIGAAFVNTPGGSSGVCVVAGPPGVGKTALAVAWASEHADEFPGGQLFADLRGFSTDPPQEPGEVLDGFVRALGGDPRPLRTMAERTAAYRSLLAGRRVLVVLDNARDPEQVRPLLPGGEECRVVVTSRHRLTGLTVRDHARRIVLAPLSEDEALRVLGGDVADGRWVAVARRCGHLPLLLRIAAERLRDDPAAMAELGSSSGVPSLDLLETDDPDSSARTVLSWSYRALSPEAATAFRALGGNPAAAIDRGGLAVLAGLSVEAVRRAVDELLRAFLVEDHDGWLTQHDLLAAYARECAAQSEPSDRLVDLVRYYSHKVSRARTWINLGEPVEEFSSLESARDWFLAALDPIGGLAVQAPAGADHELPVLAKKVVIVASRRGRADLAGRIAVAARDAAVRSGDPIALATAEGLLGTLAGRSGDPVSLDHFARAAELIASTDDRDGEMIIANNHAVLLHSLGHLPAALARFRHAKQLFDQIQTQRYRELVLDNNIGEMLRAMGRVEEAEQVLQETLRSAAELGQPELVAGPLINLAMVRLERDDLAAAGQLLDRCEQAIADTADQEAECEVVLVRGRIALAAGDHTNARDEFARAALLADELDVLRLRVDCAVGLAAVRATDDRDGALLDLDAAVAMARRHGAALCELRARELQDTLLRRAGRLAEVGLVAGRISELRRVCGLVDPAS